MLNLQKVSLFSGARRVGKPALLQNHCARVGYFKLGINLKTERPTPVRIKESVDAVTGDNLYSKNVQALRKEFSQYNPLTLSTKYVDEILLRNGALTKKAEAAIMN